MQNHKFKLRDLVDVALAMGLRPPPGPYEVVGLLPALDGEPQYRIKRKVEDHERMAKKSDLKRFVT